ncbi:fasciclin-like arabinogalactan protein 1 [Salvia hispanica]|uniref:fasciclin-like arabinogalactan protein 1 n=1 Tax=Salvia hispanica TaxID=49212 RepID=UPI00200929D4|nr:fasciclin-like arabinogalactan protein 1 [Salvia hispanica]
MKLHHAAATLITLSLFLLPSTTTAHNITGILAKYPDFSNFNNYLTATLLSPEIQRRDTITVCAIDNAAMDRFLSNDLTLGAIKNVLSLHILLDFFDAEKLLLLPNGTAQSPTLSPPPASVQITNLNGGNVAFSPKDAPAATFVKSVEAMPHNLSVIQISSALFVSPEARAAVPAPAPAPSEANLTAAMSAHGCSVFAALLVSSVEAEQAFEANNVTGLTVFCPVDEAMIGFIPIFENLTDDGKEALLEYHGIGFYASFSGLRSSNGETSTLATDGATKQFRLNVVNDGDDVTIKTPMVTAKIVGTVLDKDPVAIFQLDKVLMPLEVFRSPALAPSPATGDYSHPVSDAPAESPADGFRRKSNGAAARLISDGVILSLGLVFILLQF